MTWVAWRQHRSENVILAALYALFAAVIVLTGLRMNASFTATGLPACLAQTPFPPTCNQTVEAFHARFDSLGNVRTVFNLLPGFAGILLAAPFVLELESGTYALAWTQSITPRRWLTTRLGLILIGSAIAGVLAAELAGWWRHSFDQLDGRMAPGVFDLEGVVPVAYTMFAAAAVLAIGSLTRRTGLAVAAGFGAFAIARLAVQGWLRQRLLPPVHAVASLANAPAGIHQAWIIDHGFGDQHGHAAANATGILRYCTTSSGNLSDTCVAEHHLFQAFVYEPASRFWALQAIEAAVFVTLAGVLTALTVWLIRRRLT